MKMPLANAFCTSWFANSTSCSGSAVEAMTKSTGKLPPPGSGGGVSAMTRMPGIFESLAATSTWSCGRALLALAPRLRDHAAEAAARERDLEDVLGLGERLEDVVDLLGEELRLVERRVRRRLDDAEDDALVLLRRQLLLREHVERHDEQRRRWPTA